MSTRWDVERAVLYSDLPAPARLTVLALLVKADADTAVIPPEHTPALATIAAMTGLGTSTVARHLADLEKGKWLERTVPGRHSRYERTRYALLVPPGFTPVVPQREYSSSPAAGAVPQREYSSSPAAGPLPLRDSCPPAQTPVVPQREYSSSPAAGHATVSTKNSPTESSSPASTKPETAQTILAAFIDHCATRGVKIPKRLIGQYARLIGDALGEDFTANAIKRALAQMLDQNVVDKPSYLTNHLVAVQTGPERRPVRAPAAAPASSAPPVIPAEQRCHLHRGELAASCRRCAANAKARPMEHAS